MGGGGGGGGRGRHSSVCTIITLLGKMCQIHEITLELLRADVSKYRPEVYKSEKSTILKKIHKVALGKLLT